MSVNAVLERGGPRKLLALDGGGIRGLITVEVLGEIEDQMRGDRGDEFRLCDEFDYIAGTSTGAIIATDRTAIVDAQHRLRYAAGNFYVNDKPTGAVVGQQPFGGARGSGTNDKAGALQNLMRWTSTRTIKETFVPPRDHRYPHQG